MQNKIYIKIVATLFLTASLASCKKWVEYEPKDDYTVTNLDYLKSETDYRTMAVSVYTPLQWLNETVTINDIASDNAVSGGQDDQEPQNVFDNMNFEPVNNLLADQWKACFEGINRANYLHQFKDANPGGTAVDFAGKESLYGEIYFLRAYYYFTLVRLFGDVPLFVDRRLGPTDAGSLTRAPKAEVYAQIEADLNTAIAALPAVAQQVDKGRATKYAAQALLGKVLIYEEKFTEAAAVLDAVITSNAFTLVPDMRSIFLSAGENGPESVFEIQFSNGTPYYNWGAPTRGQGSIHPQQCGVRGMNGSAAMPYAPGWSLDLPTQELANAYEAGDQRKAATIFDVEAYKNANPGLMITYQVAPYKNTGLYSHKYQPMKGETSGQIEFNWTNNFRTIRYAEVYLLAAEAFNRAAAPNDAKARTYLNEVRARAFGNHSHDINASGTALKDAIWKERRLELAMEGDRYFDLVRTGQAAAKITGFQTGKHEVFPIPQNEVIVGGLPQNPNY